MLGARVLLSAISKELNITQLGLDLYGKVGDMFGSSIATNPAGDRIVVGGVVGSGGTGLVRVYSLNGTTLTQVGQDILGQASGDKFGYSVSINSLGDRIVVGAPHNVGNNGTNSGSVRIYSFISGAWTRLGTKDLYGDATDNQFGYSVSMNSVGDRIVVGEPYHKWGGGAYGKVKVYSYIKGVWTKLGTDIEPHNGMGFGYSVSMNSLGDRIAIGAPIAGNNNGGLAAVYSFNNKVWTKLGTDIYGEVHGGRFGFSVSMNSAGDRIVGGGYGSGGLSPVAVYSFNNKVWTRLGQILYPDDYAGNSVSINSIGDRIIVGAPERDNGNSKRNGSFDVYYFRNGIWNRVGGLTNIYGQSDYDHLGSSVSMNSAGDRIIVGAPDADNGTHFHTGSISVYKIS